MVISEDEQGNICKSQWETVASHSWRKSWWKCIMRFFITPAQKKHWGVEQTVGGYVVQI